MPFPNIPLHAQLMSLLLVATPVLMLLAIGYRSLRLHTCLDQLPPVPQFPGTSFPNYFDWFYSAFFLLFTILATISNLAMPMNGNITAGAIMMNLLLQVGIYLPFVIRYALLSAPVRHRFSPGYAVFWLLAALGCIIVPSMLMEQLGFYRWLMDLTDCPELQDIVVLFRDGNWELRCCIALAAVVVAPICEEIVYRGFIYNILKSYCNRIVAILLAGLIFSVIHGSLAQTLPLFIFGCVQCVLYDKARSLWLPMALHAVYNTITLFLILLLPL